MNIQLCSATLTALYLEGLNLGQCFNNCLFHFDFYEGSASSDLKVRQTYSRWVTCLA